MDSGVVHAVIFDLDGVLRHYDRAYERRIEQRHGLAEGALFSSSFGSHLGRMFMRGELDHDQFAAGIAALVGSIEAATEFVATRATVDRDAVALVRRVRQRVPVALLTNGSLRTRIELDESGLGDAFDHIFNSAETGVTKPEAGAYLNVIAALGVKPSAAAFVDDHPPNVAGAVEVGMIGHHYTGLAGLQGFLRVHGLA